MRAPRTATLALSAWLVLSACSRTTQPGARGLVAPEQGPKRRFTNSEANAGGAAGTVSAAGAAGTRAETNAAAPELGRALQVTTGESAGLTTPRVQLHAEAESVAEWSFELDGFPAIAKDRRTLALATTQRNASGPPSLGLILEFRDLAARLPTERVRFEQPYRGEPTRAVRMGQRRRAQAWVAEQSARLARREFRTLSLVIEREAPTCDIADDQRLAIAMYEIHLARGRLHVATTRGDVVHDHEYADWRVTKGAGDGACVYEPALAAAALDEASRVLVIRADHCPASDQCDDVLAAGFAVVRLPD